MGGLIAADYAAQYPEQIKQLILIAPAGVPTTRPIWADWGIKHGVGELMMLTLGRRILPGMLGRSFADESAASEWLPPMLQMSELAGYRRTLLSSMRHMPLSDAMAIFEEVGADDYPVGLIWGDRDEICPYENRKAVLQAIPRARLVTVEGGGHVAQLDRPHRFETAFRGFLDT